MKGTIWVTLLAFSVAIALFGEWHTDEVTVMLAVMCVLAVAIGALKPSWSVPGGAILGFSIFVAHAVTEAVGVGRPHYMHVAPAVGDWIAMALAGAFATAVSWAAGFAGTKAQGTGETAPRA
jgi:hypothetical protein